MLIELPIRPHKESGAGIGMYLYKDGWRIAFGMFFGKYCLDYVTGEGWNWCDFFCTGIDG